MLRRDALPRAELLAVFVRACGDGQHLGEWLGTRERLAVRPHLDQTPQTSPAPPPAMPSDDLHSTRSRRVSLTTAVIMLVVAGFILTTSTGTGGPPPAIHHADGPALPAPAAAVLPAPGGYLIRLRHSNLCLSEDLSDSSGQVRQRDCRRSVPPMALQAKHGDIYRIAISHPEFGAGCMGIAQASSKSGVAIYDDHCGTGAAEEFQLIPVGGAVPGFRIRAVHSGMCLGVREVSMDEWEPLFQLPCLPAGSGQIFSFEPR
ncbi:RICIN domain-containing protein [Amycolatopsis oliviviridis]|nr:hypothetical protein [Amycolatopsis oliviviridis]